MIKVVNLLLITIMLSFGSAYGEEISSGTLSGPYDEYIVQIVDGKKIVDTRYARLIHVSTTGLSEISIRQHENALAVYQQPDNEKVKLRYINEFPSGFRDFVHIFCDTRAIPIGVEATPNELSQEGYLYVELLGKLCQEYPNKVVPLMLGISASAIPLDDDAVGVLHEEILRCGVSNFKIFYLTLKTMSLRKQKNISEFLANEEAINEDSNYSEILKQLKRQKTTNLYRLFLSAKQRQLNSSSEMSGK